MNVPAQSDPVASSFDSLWTSLLPIGRNGATGGYRRFAWQDADMQCREWFRGQAESRGLDVERDRNGNLWAWWGSPGPGAIVTGSHLDSVPDGGAYDGPLGIVSAFAAIDLLRLRGVRPSRPIAVVAFSDEEGARFGVACIGSRLMTGELGRERALALRDDDGLTLAETLTKVGVNHGALGRDDESLARIGTFVELHVEQGRGLVDLDRPVGVATSIWPHGRWRFDFTGEANHAGTTLPQDRRDPMQAFAGTVLAARTAAASRDARATFGRVLIDPNGTNAIPSAVTGWLDARARDEATLDDLVADIGAAATASGEADRVGVAVTSESYTPVTTFDPALRDGIATLLDRAPLLPTAAGHDAGVLATAGVPTAMLFVRNPTGVSHSPEEHAEDVDCLAGTDALASVLADLACR